MIKPILSKTRYVPSCGDIMPYEFPELLGNFVKDESKYYIPMGVMTDYCWGVNYKPAEQLAFLDIDYSNIINTYECPYTKERWHSLVPIALITDDYTKYRAIIKDKTVSEMYLDKEWAWEQYFKDNVKHISRMQDCLLGGGYTEYCNLNDGSNKLIFVSIKLDNGDELYCVTWEWYNK